MDASLVPTVVTDSSVAQRSTPCYGIVGVRDVMVPMRDGIRLRDRQKSEGTGTRLSREGGALALYTFGDYDVFWSRDCCDQERYFDRHADIPATYSGGWF